MYCHTEDLGLNAWSDLHQKLKKNFSFNCGFPIARNVKSFECFSDMK